MAAAPAGLEIRLADGTSSTRVDELGARWEAEARAGGGVALRPRLRGAALVFAGLPAAPAPDPAVARRRAELANRAEHRAYAKLVKTVYRPPVRPEDRVAASLRHQFTVSANMVVAPVGAAGICYAISRAVGFDRPQHRVAFALLGGVAMLFIEMILFIARTYSVEAAGARRARRAARARPKLA